MTFVIYRLGLVVFALLVVTIAISFAMVVMCCMMRNRNQQRDKLEAKIEALEVQVKVISNPDQSADNAEWDICDDYLKSNEERSPKYSEYPTDTKQALQRSASASDQSTRVQKMVAEMAKSAPAATLQSHGQSDQAASVPPEHYPLPNSMSAEDSMASYISAMPSMPPQQYPLPQSATPGLHFSMLPEEIYGTPMDDSHMHASPVDPKDENQDKPRLMSIVDLAMQHKKEVLMYRPWMADELVDSPSGQTPAPDVSAKERR